MMPRHPSKTVLILLGCLGALGSWSKTAAVAEPAQAAVTSPAASQGRYIVRLHGAAARSVTTEAEIAAAHGVAVAHSYRTLFAGFAGTMSPGAAQALRRHPLVASVEADVAVSLDTVPATAAVLQEGSAPWGLDRIDQRALPLDQAYTFRRTGAGVRAYVVDTGILASHLDFEGRVEPGHTVIDDGLGSSDCNGHGTHVAGTIGGRRWGVAKGVTLVPVRVLGCSGSGMLSGVIAGLDWVASQGPTPSVVNLSLSTSRSEAFNATVAALVARGITVVAAAGNADTDACSRSPASEPGVLTVAASTAADTRAPFSNHGPCVALYAPGVAVTSAWPTAPDAAVALSGTSMAAPHTAGVAALALEANPLATPADIKRYIAQSATPQAVDQGAIGPAAPLLYALAPGAPQPWSVAVTALAPLPPEALADGRVRARLSAQVQAYDGERWTDGVAGAQVSGVFSPGGPASCTTDAAGQCVLNRCATALDAQPGSFTVLSVRAEGLVGNVALGVGSITDTWPAIAVAAGR